MFKTKLWDTLDFFAFFTPWKVSKIYLLDFITSTVRRTMAFFFYKFRCCLWSRNDVRPSQAKKTRPWLQWLCRVVVMWLWRWLMRPIFARKSVAMRIIAIGRWTRLAGGTCPLFPRPLAHIYLFSTTPFLVTCHSGCDKIWPGQKVCVMLQTLRASSSESFNLFFAKPSEPPARGYLTVD